MAFAQVRLFSISSFGSDGAPVLSATPLPFLATGDDEVEINNIEVSLEADYSEREYDADDKSEITRTLKGYNGTITVYGIDADAFDMITTFTKDANGNLNLSANSGEEPQICIFYRARDEKGTAYNMWLYDCEFAPIDLDAAQEGDSPQSIDIEFYAKMLTVGGTKTAGTRVYEGNTGFLAEGTEPTGTDIYVAA